MRKLKGVVVFLMFLGFLSCKKDAEQPKLIYEEKKVAIREPQKIDSTQIKIADLPILMEGTKYLIHPIGDVRVYDVSSKYGSTKVNQVSYAVSNYNRYELTGYFQNLMFQHIDSTALRPLTDQLIQIQTATFLNTVAEKTKNKILVYTIVDQDTNRDGKIDSNDIKSLYISMNDGTKFTKLSEDLHELLDWSVIDAQNRLYFRTIEDINKNGAFDNNDAVNYFYVDLNKEKWTIESYNPMGN